MSSSVSNSSSTPLPPVPSSTNPCFDVLSIMDAMQAAGLTEDAIKLVSNAIGHLPLSSLDPLRACGLTGKDVVMVRKRLTAPITTSFAVVRVCHHR